MATHEIYLSFDPGGTTGFVMASYDKDTNTLTFETWKQYDIAGRYLGPSLGCPPIGCFYDYYDWVMGIFNRAAAANVPVFTAVENYVGGAGGNVQNTVNKLIGLTMAANFAYAEPTNGLVTEVKLYKNTSRLRFSAVIHEMLEGNTKKYYNKHSTHGLVGVHIVAAMCHLMHRVEAEHPEEWASMKFE